MLLCPDLTLLRATPDTDWVKAEPLGGGTISDPVHGSHNQVARDAMTLAATGLVTPRTRVNDHCSRVIETWTVDGEHGEGEYDSFVE